MRPLHLLTIVVLVGIVTGSWPAATAATACAPAVASPKAEAESTIRLLETYLDRLEAIGFRGAVLVADQGEILLQEGYGAIEPGGAEPITPDTVFAIGSNTKPFTAAAILKLQDEGLLRVEDPISRYLADVPADKTAITVHHLLTHSAGLDHSGIFEGDFEAIGRDEAVRRILASELLFPPGQESSYADAGMILLAAIVEIVSGRPFAEYLRAELLAPAGMTATGLVGDAPLPSSDEAVGIVAGETAGSPSDLPALSWSLLGAGGMTSTVADLHRWHEAVESGKVLSPAAVAAYASPHVPLEPDLAEGYGWVVGEPELGHRVRASAGGNDELGHVNVIRWWQDDDLLIIASSASAAYNAEDVVPAIENILFGRPQVVPPAIAPVASERLAELAGRYELPDGGAVIVAPATDRLVLSPDGAGGFATLFPENHLASSVPADPDATIAYLESGEEDEFLDPWIADQAAALGPFAGLSVVGAAAPEGGGETWTYVAFDFALGSVLTRWVVRPGGILDAAEVPTEPPAVVFLPTSPTDFVSFALGRPDSMAAVFARNASGQMELQLRTSSAETVTGTRQD